MKILHENNLFMAQCDTCESVFDFQEERNIGLVKLDSIKHILFTDGRENDDYWKSSYFLCPSCGDRASYYIPDGSENSFLKKPPKKTNCKYCGTLIKIGHGCKSCGARNIEQV